MTNANPIITLRNDAIMWISITVFSLLIAWGIYVFVGSTGSKNAQQINTLIESIELIRAEGVMTEKNWEILTPEEKKNERWATMTKLVPSLQKLIASGTPAAGKNIITMKSISQKVGNEDTYIGWLEKSWTETAQTDLSQTQTDIAEVIPVFAGVSEVSGTETIGGKITLKSLIDYIQENIVDQYNLTNALGQIGINTVQFLADSGDIGLYEVPLQFEKVPNENVMSLLEFIGKTGGIRVTEVGKNITIEHSISRPLKNTLANESTLKNLLITIKDMVISPTREAGSIEDGVITTKRASYWDVHMTLRFYIRGASRDHIATLDTKILTLLDKNGRNGSLIARGNELLKTCNNCPQSGQIKDIIILLTNARAAYDSIITQEKNPKNEFSPIEILSHRTELMTTIETLENKLTTLSGLIIPAQ